MTRIVIALMLIGALGVLLRLAMTAPPQKVAVALRYGAAGVLFVSGLLLTVTGKAGFGVPAIVFSTVLLRQALARRAATARPGQKSRVNTDALIMELDLDSGEMSGLVLKGEFEGAELKSLGEAELMRLYRELAAFKESRDLLEAYLDRRIPDWRDRMNADDGGGLGGAPGSGPMTQEEAYEILGLSPGAGETEIRQAHRRLMKRVHPDTGGSSFLAARLNEAKDILLRRHV